MKLIERVIETRVETHDRIRLKLNELSRCQHWPASDIRSEKFKP